MHRPLRPGLALSSYRRSDREPQPFLVDGFTPHIAVSRYLYVVRNDAETLKGLRTQDVPPFTMLHAHAPEMHDNYNHPVATTCSIHEVLCPTYSFEKDFEEHNPPPPANRRANLLALVRKDSTNCEQFMPPHLTVRIYDGTNHTMILYKQS